MKTFLERTKASSATRAKLAKPLDRRTAAAFKVKVKNMISDLDGMAWSLENQIDMDPTKSKLVVHYIDKLIKEAKVLEGKLNQVFTPKVFK